MLNWLKRFAAKKEPVVAPVTAAPAAPVTVTTTATSTAMAAPPVVMTAADQGEKYKVMNKLDADTITYGDMYLKHGLEIYGQHTGKIVVETESLLVIRKGAHVAGDVAARCMVIHGEVHGRVMANKIIIAPTARIKGEVIHAPGQLRLVDGAHIEGQIMPNPQIDLPARPQIEAETVSPKIAYINP